MGLMYRADLWPFAHSEPIWRNIVDGERTQQVQWHMFLLGMHNRHPPLAVTDLQRFSHSRIFDTQLLGVIRRFVGVVWDQRADINNGWIYEPAYATTRLRNTGEQYWR